MLLKLIDLSCRNNIFVIFLVAVLAGVGLLSLREVPVDAIPDLTDTQVIVYSTWDVSPDIIEDQVTFPIISNLMAVPGVRDIRGLSTFGASFVYVIFEDGTDIYWARSRVLEYMANIAPQLPEGVDTRLGPDATGVGWIFQYALKDTSGQNSLEELRSFQDWFLRYQLQALPGVAEVASFGGYQKQYQVQIDPQKLRAYNIPLRRVAEAIRQGNSESGAKVLESSGAELMIRLRGYARSLEDIEHIVVGSNPSGTPVYVKNVANVVFGPEMRRAVSDLDGLGEAVGGIVVMRYGENAQAVIDRVKQRLTELEASLPEGVELVTTYDRSELIQGSLNTLRSKIVAEMFVVGLVIFIFLLHFNSSLVPTLILPAAVLIAFIPMFFFGVSANIMSMSGIIIAIGVMVDAAIVVVENCHKKLGVWRQAGGRAEDRVEVIVDAVKEVGTQGFYSLLVIAVAFLPVFALEAQEGKLFHPLAYTNVMVLVVAAVLSITFAPALLVLLLDDKKFSFRPRWLSFLLSSLFRPNKYSEETHPISRGLIRIYNPTVNWVVKNPWKIVLSAVALVVLTVPVFFKLGSEFMPPLNEQTILYMPTTMPGISVAEASRLVQTQGKILKSFPEVLSVHGKAGRADTATDPAPLSMMETVVVLKPPHEWREKERWYSPLPDVVKPMFRWVWYDRLTYEELIQEMNRKMQFPGLTNAWTMPIKGRIDMLTTGIRTPVGIKVAGSDLNEIAVIGEQLEAILSDVPGTRSVFSERVTGGYFLDIRFDREALARHGINMQKAHDDVSLALGGRNVTTTIEGRERYGVQVRYARGYREDIQDLNQILLESPRGYQLPLGSVAHLSRATGPGMIRNENGLLTGYVFVDLETSDVGGYVSRAQKLVREELSLPAGYSLQWSGQYESIARVQDRLEILVPIALLVIALLIFLNTRSPVKTTLVLCTLPFSALGAIWFLFALDYNMSIATWVGLIALLGVDAETSIYMMLYMDLSIEDSKKKGKLKSTQDLIQAIHYGSVQRIRPKVMTVMTTVLGLLPVLLATTSATGADMMKRLVAPMVGGIFTSFLLELLVYPAIYVLWKRREYSHLVKEEPLR